MYVCVCFTQSAIDGRMNFLFAHTTQRIIVFCSSRFPLKCVRSIEVYLWSECWIVSAFN